MGDETKLFLVDTTVNWADEMDVCGYAIYNGAELQKMIDYVAKQDSDWTWSVYLGTNEDTELTKTEVLDMLECAERISEEDAEFLMDKVGQCEHNIFEDIMEANDNEDEDEE